MAHCLLQSGLGLVLVEGEEKLPSILAAANVSTISKPSQSNGLVKSNAPGGVSMYGYCHVLVMCIATVLASLF